MYPFEFEEDDILWDIVKRYGMTPNEVRTAVLAWAYTVARERDRDETWEKLNEAYKAFNRIGRNLDRNKMKEMYHLK